MAKEWDAKNAGQPLRGGGHGRSRKQTVAGARTIRMKELPSFTRQLAAMLSSGMPVVQTLDALEDQTQNKAFKPVIAGVRTQIEGGTMLSEALRAYPTVFDDLYINMMRAGETSGTMAETIDRIAGFLEASSKLRRKVKSAMMYPTIVLSLALVIATGMIMFIVPVFANIFADFGAKLPGPTQFLMNVSDGLRNNSAIIFPTLIAAVYGFIRFKKTEKGAFMWDRFILRFPVVGELARKIAVARFASTFAQLIRSGVPILQALDIVAFAMGNKVLGKLIMEAKATVERGEPLSNALEKSSQFPRLLVHMLSAGEKTGRMDDMLDKIAEFYDDEVQAMLSGLTSMIEPLLMVFLGVIIGGIVLCMFMPIFKMHEIVNF